jgi:hypothetical protein
LDVGVSSGGSPLPECAGSRRLARSSFGRALIRQNYGYSPQIAAFIERRPTLRLARRLLLTLLVLAIEFPAACDRMPDGRRAARRIVVLMPKGAVALQDRQSVGPNWSQGLPVRMSSGKKGGLTVISAGASTCMNRSRA